MTTYCDICHEMVPQVDLAEHVKGHGDQAPIEMVKAVEDIPAPGPEQPKPHWRSKQIWPKNMGSEKPIPGRCGRKLKNQDPPRYCMQYPKHGRTACRKHGGATPAGIASANYVHGKRSRYVPQRLWEKYEDWLATPELSNAHERNLAVLELRISDIFQRLDEQGEGPDAWQELLEIWEQLDAAREAKDNPLILACLDAAGDVIKNKGAREAGVWREVRAVIQEQTTVQNAHDRKMEAAQKKIEVERALMMITAVTSVVFGRLDDIWKAVDRARQQLRVGIERNEPLMIESGCFALDHVVEKQSISTVEGIQEGINALMAVQPDGTVGAVKAKDNPSHKKG